MIAIANRKAAAQTTINVTFESTSIDELNIPNASLDIVLGLKYSAFPWR